MQTKSNNKTGLERQSSHLFPEFQDVSIITVACRRLDYSASSLARAVEDCDTLLLNLNITDDSSAELDKLVIELRVNRRNPAAVCRSLERYGYDVVSVDTNESETDASDESIDDSDPMTIEMRRRANELLHYLEM